MSEQWQWSGTCEECAAVFVVAPHPEATDGQAGRIADGPDEWEMFTECWVCGESSIDWVGSDPVGGQR